MSFCVAKQKSNHLQAINLKITIKNNKQLWHIQKEDNHLQDKEREERMIMPKHPQWLYVPIAGHGMFIIPYVATVVTTEGN